MDHPNIDINLSPMEVAQQAFKTDVEAVIEFAGLLTDVNWSEATKSEHFNLIHGVLAKVVERANHAGLHIMEIESLSLAS